MSDSWVLCPKCGEELEWFGWIEGQEYYYCPNGEEVINKARVKVVTTEYLRGEEDEKGNQSRRSKK